MDALRQDVRYAVRAALRAPLFTLSLLLTLSLALAAAITTFGVLDAVLGKPLPLEAPERVYIGWTRDEARDFDHYPLPYSVVEALPDRVPSVEALGAMVFFGATDWLIDAGARDERISLALVTGDIFGALGARPASGDLPGWLDPVASDEAPLILSYAYWQRRFGGAPIVGTSVRIEDRPYRIEAVAPEGFEYPENVEAWAPIRTTFLATAVGGSPFLDLVVRLTPGASEEQARAELERAVRELYSELEGFDAARHTMVIRPITTMITGDARPWLRGVAVLVALLLGVATLNAAVLLLIRALDRARESAVRIAAGATRARMLRLIATENAVLALVACVIALTAAAWGLDILRAAAPPGLPRVDTIRLDLRVALFAASATLLVSIALSAAIASAMWVQRPGILLRSGAWQVGAIGARLRDAIVVGQIALTVVVLGAAGALARSLYNLSSLDAGFGADAIVLADVALPRAQYPDPAAARQAFQEILAAVEALPGVERASGLSSEPFPDGESVMVLTAEGQDPAQAADNPLIDYEGVDGAYFETLRPRILRGRGIEDGDRGGAEPVVVVNQSLARLFWPGDDAVGKRLKFGGPDATGQWRTVVGVIDDMQYRRFADPRPAVYFHREQGMAALAPSTIAIRAQTGGPDIAELRETVARVAPGAAVIRAPRLTTLLDRPLAWPRFHVLLLGCFAVTALILTAVGVYGTQGTNVRQRRGELAVRLALGAMPRQLQGMVIRRAIVMSAVGAAVGALIGLLALRTIASLLYDVGPNDPVILAAVGVVILATSALAAWIPARGATATQPTDALRAD